MARPAWWSKDDPPYVLEGTVVRANPGNWRQFPGGEALVHPRYIYRWWVDGQPFRQYASDPIANRAAPDAHYLGEGEGALDIARFGPGAHNVTFQVWAGSFFKGWGDTPEDFYEYGGDKNTDGSPYVVGLGVTVPNPEPQPPSSPTGDEFARRGFADLQRAVVYWAENGLKPGEIEATRAWIALRMKLLPKDSPKLAEIRRLLA